MISNKATIPQVIEKIKIILKFSRLWVGSNFTPLESMMAARPQKTAKFAILSHGHAGFPNRVKRSEGSDTTPTSHVQKVLRTE